MTIIIVITRISTISVQVEWGYYYCDYYDCYANKVSLFLPLYMKRICASSVDDALHRPVFVMLSSWVDTLYTFWNNITHYKTESVYFLWLMNSATKNAIAYNPKSPPLCVRACSCAWSRTGYLRNTKRAMNFIIFGIVLNTKTTKINASTLNPNTSKQCQRDSTPNAPSTHWVRVGWFEILLFCFKMLWSMKLEVDKFDVPLTILTFLTVLSMIAIVPIATTISTVDDISPALPKIEKIP